MSTSTIKEIEDTLIETVKDLELFKKVGSLGRSGKPVSMSYPSSFVYFAGDEDTGAKPRPTRQLTYEALVINKNMSSEAKAARDTYDLIDAVDMAINGKQLGYTDIEPFVCTERILAGYDEGEITYLLRFKTRHYLDI